MRLRDYFLILVVVFIWGTNFVAIRWGLDDMPPFLFNATRFFLVAFPAVFFIPKPATSWRNIALLGLFICTLQFSLLFLAMQMGLPAGVASLLMQVQVVFTLLLSAMVFKERVIMGQVLGVLVAFSGFGVLTLSDNPTMPNALPFFIALAGAFAWACGNLVYKVSGDANRFHLTVYAALIAPVPMLIMSLLFETHNPIAVLGAMSFKGWGSLLYNSLLSTIVAYGIWGTLLGRYPSILVVPWSLLVPVFGMSAAALLLGEHITRQDILAALLILAGLFICIIAPEWKKHRARKWAGA